MIAASGFEAFRDLFGETRIYWQSFFGGYVVGLDRLLPVDVVGCLDEGADFDAVTAATGIGFCTFERPGARRRNWIGATIDALLERREAEVERRLAERADGTRRATSNPACERLERLCSRNGYGYVGPRAAVAARFAPKRVLREAVASLGLPPVPGRSVERAGARLAALASELGLPFVAQAEEGAAGSGTVLVRDESDLARAFARPGCGPIRASSLLGDTSLNVNAAVIGGACCVGPPNVQLAGVPDLGAPWGGYCGNDYGAAWRLEASIVADVVEQTRRIGEWLAAQGFEGLFGLDYVIAEADGRARAVDLNPRWQGSTALSVQAEMRAGRLPLAAVEIGYRCGVIGADAVAATRDRSHEPLDGYQLCLRMQGDAEAVVGGGLRPGVYAVGGEPRLLRDGFRLEDARGETECLVGCGVPRPGTVVEPGAWLVRVLGRGRAVGTSSSALAPRAAATAAGAYRALGLPSPTGAHARRSAFVGDRGSA